MSTEADHIQTESDLQELCAKGAPVEILLLLLQEQHPLYRGVGAAAVVRMRGLLLLGLGRCESLPAAALPFLIEELESAHEPYLTAAAAHVLRTTASEKPPRLVPALLAALRLIRHRDNPVDLGSAGGEHTTAVREVLQTLAHLAGQARPALPDLHALRGQPLDDVTHRLLMSAISRLESAKTTPPPRSCCDAVPDSPAPVVAGSVMSVLLEDQDGASLRFQDLFVGKPSLVAFFYTRCENPAKCSRTMTRLGELQRSLADEGLLGAVRIAALTYDPEFDVPSRLSQYARRHGFLTDQHHRVLRTLAGGMQALAAFFELGVNYSSGTVNRHQVELHLLDDTGGIHASFTRLQASDASVIRAIRELSAGASS